MSQPGPCKVCGKTNYPSSLGGPDICPECDCGSFNPNILAYQNAKYADRLAALEKWGREMVKKDIGERFGANGKYYVCELCGCAGNTPSEINHKLHCLIDQAHTLGLVED